MCVCVCVDANIIRVVNKIMQAMCLYESLDSLTKGTTTIKIVDLEMVARSFRSSLPVK